MSKVMITSGLALLLSLNAAPTAWADPDTQEPAVVVVEADAGREERLTLASRYLELTITEALSKSMTPLVDQMMKDVGDASEEEQAWAREQFPEMMTGMMQAMVERMAPIYADRLSEDELAALVEFFQTPQGRSISRRLVEASLDQQEVLVDVMTETIAEYEAKYCAVFDCEALTLGATSQKDGY